ncbi:phospholipase D-like domain-containing protein [Halonatronum saccharophilum]|uniref:phospholipase D-like domain-containing protein n=1 Tax=Halonatronum saccharophilum TaxID=150060 RepID=UPI0004AD5472|nr:phospholipase D family protein [Halonatronum saccharophilum]
MRIEKAKSTFGKILILYFLYAFITGVIIFLFHGNKKDLYFTSNKIQRFWGEEIGQDRVALIEDRCLSGKSRIDLINNAEGTLDIAYYTIHKGFSSKVFFGKILEAADRGVKVRILLDGIFHNLRGASRDIKYALLMHPNIELKFYEPLSFFRPWTWNNRLHDKYIIVDNKFAMIGGRNIGDKFFLKDYKGEVVYDRDVVIINTDVNNSIGSVIIDMKEYFENVWGHHFSKHPIVRLSNYQMRRGREKEVYLKGFIEKTNEINPKIFSHSIDWYGISVSTNKITLIHNPITRFNKEPWVLGEIARLIKEAEESILIQSPYIIPTKEMLKYIPVESIGSKEVSILTNSIASSPNYFAMSGYRNNRKAIVDYTTNLYEYHGKGSIHGKTFIIDDQINLVGSFNLDSRSSFLSTESMVVIDSKEFTEALKQETDNLIKESLLVGEDYSYKDNPLVEERRLPIIKDLIIRVLSVAAYFFDFLL